MKPCLIGISGLPEGVRYEVDLNSLTIGREATNQICLPDPLVSRQHCLIERRGLIFLLRDLDSSNGTLVNGIPVRERVLAHGDQIRVGDSLLLFLTAESQSEPEPGIVQIDEGFISGSPTIELRREEIIYHRPEAIGQTQAGRLAHVLGVLFRVTRELHAVQSYQRLQQRLLELIFELTPADMAVIAFAGDGKADLATFWGMNRELQEQRPLRISRTVLDRVITKGVAILCNNVTSSRDFHGAASLSLEQISGFLAVPLVIHQWIHGVIFLGSRRPEGCFDENHLQMIATIANMAAPVLASARRIEALELEAERLRAELSRGNVLIGESQAMREIGQLITKVAPSDSTVLVLGESGTGKEMVAQAIHRLSSRASRPFVAINCAGLNENLLESDLFGHERGSFSGAVAQKKGRFEIADGGTVFLDEMGELPMSLQARLLRVLQTREFERVGGTRPIRSDIRLIAATNRNLEESVRSGAFRLDLFYRLNVVTLTLPPLRARRNDIPLLAHYFALKYAERCKREVKGLTRNAVRMLMKYDWPGNVRELENAIERAVVMGSTDMIQPEDLPESLLDSTVDAEEQVGLHLAAKEAKKQMILQTLKQTGGNFTEAARLLGIHPNNLHRLVRTLGLRSLLKEQAAI